ncbi:MAG: TldD/PmbA family protein [Erysipelotrichia bacterium]|nr:TldD/PmbA family protein [Erysipelotrichia bacterium]
MAKYDKFFALAKENGLEEVELHISESRNLSISLFHGEVDNYADNNGYSIVARGILNGKSGSATCDVWNNKKAAWLVKEMVSNAGVIENDDPVFIFKGSEKYRRVSTFNRALENVQPEEKLAKLRALEKAVKEGDPRVIEVASVQYEQVFKKVTLVNSNGLNLTQRSNYFYAYAHCVAKEGEQTKSGYELFLGNDFAAFDPEVLAKKIVAKTVEQLGGEACSSNKYKAVLHPDVVASLIKAYVGHASAEEVQKQSSLFIGKVGQQIASKKVTIEDRPLNRNVFARWFDDEGVATYNKPIVKNGVLQTYLYNLTTAAKAGVETTGNGYGGAKKSVLSTFTYLKPGRKSLDELFAKVGDGVYITDVSGLHAGLNPQSGNFSLQSTGFLIEDGKKGRPLDLVTISGNLIDVFKDVVEVGNDVTLSPSGVSTQSVLIKQIGVSGK